MLAIRRFEERCVELYSAGEIRGFVHLCIGEEAVSVGVLQALAPEDAVVTTYREHGHALARGIPAEAVLAEMLGRVTGCSRGGRGTAGEGDRRGAGPGRWKRPAGAVSNHPRSCCGTSTPRRGPVMVEPITYREAIRAALREALTADERVFLMGEDVGRYGGAFGVSLGLLEEFGPERIRDTPLSESAFTGAGIGAAIAGLRPIVEIMPSKPRPLPSARRRCAGLSAT